MEATTLWPSRNAQHQQIIDELSSSKKQLGLKGLVDAAIIETLALQIVASLRREDYYQRVQDKAISPHRADPNNASFDAERAVTFYIQKGKFDEAGWLIFLMTHFARRPDTGWRRLQDVYGCLGAGIWDWTTVTANPEEFYLWLAKNWKKVRGNFGNHRKYESLRPTASRPMSRAVDDYIKWIGPNGHKAFFAAAVHAAGNDPHAIFDKLYNSMKIVSFGRLAKFDYLSLIGRYGLAPISAGSAYLDGATGPGRGARLLFDGIPSSNTSNLAIQGKLDQLDARINVGMAVLEDALCNWQKSPSHFIHYKG